MHKLVDKVLKKQSIENVTKLSSEEKNTYDRWNRILSEGEITVDKIVEFCQGQISIIEGHWKNLDNTQSKNERLILLHTVYKNIINCIKAPKAEKESLEKYLNQLLQ